MTWVLNIPLFLSDESLSDQHKKILKQKKETEKENSASFELVSNHQPRWSKQMQLHKLESW